MIPLDNIGTITYNFFCVCFFEYQLFFHVLT